MVTRDSWKYVVLEGQPWMLHNLNEDPYEEGWILLVNPTNIDTELKEIMDFNAAVEWHKELEANSE